MSALYASTDDLVENVSDVLKQLASSDRNPIRAKRLKAEALEAQAAKIRAEIEPVLMEADRVQAAVENP
jgi:hypothetical protein